MAEAEQSAAWKGAYDVWLTALDQTYEGMVQTVAAQVPNILSAVLLGFTGWLLAIALRAFILRVGIGIDHLLAGARERAGLPRASARWSMSRILAIAGYWAVLLFFATVAVRLLGLPWLAQIIREILLYVPVLLGSAAVLFVVYLASVLVRDLVEAAASAAGIADAPLLGRFARGGVLVLAAVIVLDQIGIEIDVLVNILTVVAAAATGGTALAFGIGASGAVRDIIAGHQIRRVYRVGQRVRVDLVEGEILELTPVAVVLDGVDGRVHMPAHVFAGHVSVLLEGDGVGGA